MDETCTELQVSLKSFSLIFVKHLFREEIEAKGITGYDLSYFISAGYDSPMTFWNRRNEVIFKVL